MKFLTSEQKEKSSQIIDILRGETVGVALDILEQTRESIIEFCSKVNESKQSDLQPRKWQSTRQRDTCNA